MAGVNHSRRRGRPRRDAGGPELNKRRILAAATEAFARDGYGGARINEIARRAGTNKRMLYHYFGGKDGLYVAVLEEAYAAFRAAERKLSIDALTPKRGLRRLIEFTFDYCAENPHFIALLNNENLYQGRHLRGSARVRALYPPLIDSIRKLLARGRAAGAFRNGVDPARLYISIAALGYFYFSNVHTLSVALDRDLSAPAERRAQRNHVVDLVLSSLRLDTRAAATGK
ncbi:MAG TPA: TetR/AcrR family transcriptional regulator [Alphaproteobacteria bacterium]|nr:TetR/AcrR family transcriptional regulator [Alphaproteobacteria bacterium]